MKLSTPKRTEVEIRIAQEIKNHQDFVYQTNQALQNLGNQIKVLSQQLKDDSAKKDSDHKSLQIELENFLEKIGSFQKSIYESTSASQAISTVALKKSKEQEKELKTNFVRLSDFFAQILQLKNENEKIKKDLELHQKFVASAISALRQENQENISSLKIELKPIDVDYQLIEEEISERMRIYDVDFKGLQKEIELLKRSDSYSQKKFENLYTLIHRLQERKS